MSRVMRGVRTADCCLLAALAPSGCIRMASPISLGPGDAVLAGERWF
jgi:hypothetical protein